MREVNKSFFRYVLPSVLSFALSGVYTIVDAFFIGNRLGDMGIAAVTLGYPITAFVQALGTGLGLAGAIRFTILTAQGKQDSARSCLGGTSLLMLLGSGLVTGLVLGFLYPMLKLLGAEGAVLEPTAEYVRCIVLGAVFQVLGTGLVPFVRNMGGASFAMSAMLCGFGGNIVLDWLLVWHLPYGMAGAAWASVLGQGLTALMAIAWLAWKKAAFCLPSPGELPGFCRNVFRVSAAPFGLVLCPNVTLLFMNRFLLIHGGEQALAAYGVVGYVVFIVILLLQGVNDGCQPLISRYYGQRKTREMLRVRTLAYCSGFALALFSILVLWLVGDRVGLLFGSSADVNALAHRVLPWFMAAMPLEAYVRTGSAYLYATEKSSLSYLLVYSEPALILMYLLLLPKYMGLMGVWQANPLARLTAAAIALVVKILDDRRSLDPIGKGCF